MNPKIAEVDTEWYKFQFYEDGFSCQYDTLFKHHDITIKFKDVEKIEHLAQSYNFRPFYTYSVYLKSGKPIVIRANSKEERAVLMESFDYINMLRANFIMKSIHNNSQ